MQLQLQDFATLVRNMAASIGGSARTLLDLTPGSVLRAILEANASIALWLQWIAVQILAATRAATCNGTDLDSWVADFGLARLPGQAATTSLTFARFTPGLPASIPVGAQVKTGDATLTFTVLADPSNPAFAVAAYTIPAAAAAVTVPAQAAAPGTAGNVASGAITLLATAMPGVDTVTNPTQAAGGLDAEPDAALRARFTNFIDSRSRATPAAIAFTIQSLQQGLSYVLAENTDPSGITSLGVCTVTVDDGSGAPPPTTLASVAAAIDTVRPVGTRFAVQPPVRLVANIALAITTTAAARTAAQANAASAIKSYVAALPIGGPLPLSRIAALAYAADPAITNVASIAINGSASDLVPLPNGIVRPGIVTVD